MSLFDLFGRKKREEEEEILRRQREEQAHEDLLEKQKREHEGLAWPEMPRLNIFSSGKAQAVAEPEVSPERREELGQLIYEPEIPQETLQGMTLQEVIFVLTAEEMFHKHAPLEGYEKTHRALYNEVLRRIREAKEYYVLFDLNTDYPLIDGTGVPVYLEKEHAETAAKLYASQLRKTKIMVFPGEKYRTDEKKTSLFDYLFYFGAERLILDNGWYKAYINRSDLAAPPNLFEDKTKTLPYTPALLFALTDLAGEQRWKVNYENRPQILQKKQDRVFRLMKKASFILPAEPQEAGAVPEGEGAKKELKLIAITAGKKHFLPMFTDISEYKRHLQRMKDGKAAPVPISFAGAVNISAPLDGIIINPAGCGLIIPKESLAAMTQPEAK